MAEPAETLQALVEGDERAWAAFLAQHDPVITGVTGWSKWRFDPHTREDVAQKTRVDLRRSLASFQGDCPLEHHVKQIAVRRCIDEVRRQVRERRVIEPLWPTESGDERRPEAVAGRSFDPVRAVVLAERARALRRLLDELDETCRAAVSLFYLEGRTYRAMAERLKVTVNTIGSRLSKCLTKLRGLVAADPDLKEDWADPGD